MLFLANGAPQNLTKTLNSEEKSNTIEISAPENLNISIADLFVWLPVWFPLAECASQPQTSGTGSVATYNI